ncbi:MAG: signal peptidase II [Lachnospiraceae bacterium]|nr:signal peptidase II [Lachnospiraceae bacterium]
MKYALIALLSAATDSIFKDLFERKRKNVVKNKGFAKGRGSDKPGFVAFVSAVVTLLAGIALVWAPAFKSDDDPSMSGIERKFKDMYRTGMSFIVGGGLSNSFDRVKKRYVVDYLPAGNYVYNLSDVFIYVGTFLSTFAILETHDLNAKGI